MSSEDGLGQNALYACPLELDWDRMLYIPVQSSGVGLGQDALYTCPVELGWASLFPLIVKLSGMV